ncbi:MAG: magnesium and cobalt transport protein CorA [Candidatus Dadabacteria bacterium]|nr:MAG: magnesium and cobalt transport protein CorA [Candidatus Dadabacteria bacterium]
MNTVHKRRSRKKPGTAPGTLIHVGEKKVDKERLTLIRYNSTDYEQLELEDLSKLRGLPQVDGVTWLNLDGLHNVELIGEIGSLFNIHPLVLEDCLSTSQRPKVEEYGDHIFIVMKMLYVLDNEVEVEQLSIIIGPGIVLTLQERSGDVFSEVRNRLINGKGRLRKSGPDYLVYALIDAVVDHYFIVIDEISLRIDKLDIEVFSAPHSDTIEELYLLKRRVTDIRSHVSPLRDVLGKFLKAPPDFISEETQVFFRDVYDHLLQVVESVDIQREILSGLVDMYLSVVGNRANETMKVLTIIATIFIPVTFVAGVYGMNFEVMPELKWKFGYAYAWGLMLLIAGVMLIFFKRKRWF